ncbi:type II toxin-antitoxin system RelE family toxin [Protofrankia coriariae]|uniref:type II toxin-antitoxin system RelE family toxin n=1 Tax=Protofrankia coriariae TaxID=1562887 RepID=UPI00064056A6|nr:type II toxin-antitoxin system RelE/ParE family toxin [Protofrankia coriariae]
MAASDEEADAGAAEKPSPYTVLLSRQARRNLSEHLPLDVAIAATEAIYHTVALSPSRAGKPLNEPFDGYYSARRGTYRIIYRIDEARRVVEIHSIRHRRDAYRA